MTQASATAKTITITYFFCFIRTQASATATIMRTVGDVTSARLDSGIFQIVKSARLVYKADIP